MFVYVCACMFVYVCVCLCVCMSVCMHVCVCVCVCVCVLACVHYIRMEEPDGRALPGTREGRGALACAQCPPGTGPDLHKLPCSPVPLLLVAFVVRQHPSGGIEKMGGFLLRHSTVCSWEWPCWWCGSVQVHLVTAFPAVFAHPSAMHVLVQLCRM
jgi:hypothetical protein